MIKQNIEVALSAEQKIELHRSTDLDSLKIFEELTFEEMKELILYCVYPSESKGEYEPLPSKKLFPHQLAFYHSHPRETMGYQYDTLDHLRYCAQLGTDDLREKIAKSSRDLLKDVVGNQAEKLGITNKVLNNLINQAHYMFGSVLLDAQSLGLCLKREDIVMDVGLTALSYLRTAPRSLSEPADDILVAFAKKGDFDLMMNIVEVLSMRKSYKKTFQCFVYATEWPDEQKMLFEESRIASAIVGCLQHLKRDAIIEIISVCKPAVKLGIIMCIKKYVIDPRLSEKEIVSWLRQYRSGFGPHCLLRMNEKLEELHASLDNIIDSQKTTQ
jgi:hypothetical protein